MIIGDADGNEEENVKMWIYQYINFHFRNDEKCEILTANRESNIEHLRHSFTPSRTKLRALKSRAGARHNVDAQLLKVRKERETEAENSIMQRNRLVIFHQSPFFRL